MRCADDVSIDQLAAEGIGGTHMFTGADLAGLCRRAVTFAFMEDDNAQVCLPRWGVWGCCGAVSSWGWCCLHQEVAQRHFQQALEGVTSSVPGMRLLQLEKWTPFAR